MRIKRRPLWIWIGAVYAGTVFASAAGLVCARSLGLGA